MIEARRKPLHDLKYTSASHAGLWLDRYLYHQIKRSEKLGPNQEKPLVTLMKAATAQRPSPEYQGFFTRWNQLLRDLGAQCREAHVLGRMIIGLGDESALETSVALHHTYGVPYIPGSALKGLAARFARQRLGEQWEVGSCAHRVVFGDTANAGYISFFDALYVPGTGYARQALHPDVITVHHPKYYQDASAPPADWDSPNPVPFLSATGDYLIALGGDERWVDATFDILALALAEMGIGAKTSSGYGRMELKLPWGDTDTRSGTTQQEQRDRQTLHLVRHEDAEKLIAPLRNRNILVRMGELVADEGCFAQLKDRRDIPFRCFVSADQFRGRKPEGDRNCVVRDLIERDGELLISLEWPIKKKR